MKLQKLMIFFKLSHVRSQRHNLRKRKWTLSVEEIPKPVEKLAEPIPYAAEKAPLILDNDVGTNFLKKEEN